MFWGNNLQIQSMSDHLRRNTHITQKFPFYENSTKSRFKNCFHELEMASILLSLKWGFCKCSHGGLKNMVPLAGLGEVRVGQLSNIFQKPP